LRTQGFDAATSDEALQVGFAELSVDHGEAERKPLKAIDISGWATVNGQP
jgi:hypothetical protein